MDPLSEHVEQKDEVGDHPLSNLEVKNIGIINLEDKIPAPESKIKKRFDWAKFLEHLQKWTTIFWLHSFYLQIFSAPTTFTSTLIVLLTAYFIGNMGLPYILLICLFFVSFRSTRKSLPRFTVDQLRQSAGNIKNLNPESCIWFNIMWTQLWPHWSPIMAESTKAKLKQKLETSLNQIQKKQGPIVSIFLRCFG